MKKAYKVPFKVPFKEISQNEANGARNGVESVVPFKGAVTGKQKSPPSAIPDIIEVTSEDEQETDSLKKQERSSRSALEILPPLDESSDEEQQHDLEVGNEIRRSCKLNLF